MVNKKIKVNLTDTSYEVIIGKGVSLDKKIKSKFIYGKEILLISDKNIPEKKINIITSSVEDCGPHKLNSLKLKLNERSKNFTSVSKIHNFLIKKKYTRDSLIICIGGGILSDVSGFAAATYLRGINFMLMPSTLLAQVDASIGGKTGINHLMGKNLIGSFHQPKLVLVDITFLRSLSPKDIAEGYAEIIKHCLIKDKKLFCWLENKLTRSKKLSDKDLIKLIFESINIKRKIVQKDEKEKGLRAILNFGHTFGHAFELIGGYKTYSHGQGVALGILIALEVSKKFFLISDDEIKRVKLILKKARLIIKPKKTIDVVKFYSALQMDKKRNKESLQFILLQELGLAVIKKDIPKKIIFDALKQSF